MKSTLIMLACIATLIITWMTVSFVFYMISDTGITFREVAGHGAMGMFLLMFGWIPSIIVAYDLEKKLSN